MANNEHGTKVAVANMQTRHYKKANLAKIVRLVEEAAAQHADLLVLPECCLQGYPSGTGNHDGDEFVYHYKEAETVPGPSTRAVQEAARDHNLIVIFGMTELAGTLGPGGLLFNSVVTVGRDGVLGVYRKVHTGDLEKQLWQRGTDFPVIDTSIGRIGSLICYDIVFPEAPRTLALRGAEMIAMSTAWAPSSPSNRAFERGYDLLTCCRALENQVWLVVAAQTGTDPDSGAEYLGCSRVVSPTGEVILDLGSDEGLGVASIDVREGIIQARARGWFGQVFLRDRAPESYGAIGDASLYSPPTAPRPA